MPEQPGRPSEKSREATRISVPATFVIPADLRLIYADIVQVQVTDHDARLAFFQAILPVAGSLADTERIKSANAVCVAQIALPQEVMKQFVELLQGYEELR